MNQSPPAWFWPLFPFFFVGMWLGVWYLLPAVGGWRALARCYRDEMPRLEGKTFRFQSACVGWVGYNNCVHVTVNPTGLRFAIFPPVGFGHRPFRVPWRDVRVEFRDGLERR